MNSPTEQHLGTALRDLVAEQPFTPDVRAIERCARQARRRDRIVRGGIGAGVVAVAAAAAIGVATTLPSTPTGTPRASGTHRAGSSGSPGTQAPLVKLAAFVSAEHKPAGDATLVERKTGAPGQSTINVWDLYADDGRYFFSQTQAGLPGQVKKDHNLGNGQFGREVAAAIYAVHGNLDTAALRMAWPFATPVPGWLKAQVKDMKADTQINGYVWANSEDALIAGSGNPQVRAGVLRLLSLLPDLKLTRGSTDGQPTFTLAHATNPADLKRAALAGLKHAPAVKVKLPTGPNYTEAITVNAKTGIPLQITDGPTGKVTGIVSYVVTRVKLADIAAGKF